MLVLLSLELTKIWFIFALSFFLFFFSASFSMKIAYASTNLLLLTYLPYL